MDKEFFHRILKKYLEGRATEGEKAIIDRWYKNMGNEAGSFPDSEAEADLGKRYWLRIKTYISTSRRAGWNHWRWYSVGLAASVLLILVSYLNMSYRSGSSWVFNDGADLRRTTLEGVVNDGAVSQLFYLPDGSEIMLEPQSKLYYGSDFGENERKVYLNGKAFFKVVHDESQPFRVVTREVITKVLGTSFTVSAFRRDKDVIVSVMAGKVSVYKREEDFGGASPNEVILTRNQEFVYNREERKIQTTIVREPLAVIPPEEVKRMRFEETSPKVVFEAIEKVYGVDIVFDEEKFSSCKITTNISDGNILNRLKIICEVINATYRLEDTRIIIEGEGCFSI